MRYPLESRAVGKREIQQKKKERKERRMKVDEDGEENDVLMIAVTPVTRSVHLCPRQMYPNVWIHQPDEGSRVS